MLTTMSSCVAQFNSMLTATFPLHLMKMSQQQQQQQQQQNTSRLIRARQQPDCVTTNTTGDYKEQWWALCNSTLPHRPTVELVLYQDSSWLGPPGHHRPRRLCPAVQGSCSGHVTSVARNAQSLLRCSKPHYWMINSVKIETKIVNIRRHMRPLTFHNVTYKYSWYRRMYKLNTSLLHGRMSTCT